MAVAEPGRQLRRGGGGGGHEQQSAGEAAL